MLCCRAAVERSIDDAVKRPHVSIMEMFRGGEDDDDLSSCHPVDEDGYLLSGEESEESDEGGDTGAA